MITGISGGEWGVRGFLAAYDINTGKQVWKAYSTGPDAEMLIDPDKTMTWTDGALKPVGKDSSLKTWQGDQWKTGGGTTWGWYSYDKALNLLYYGTGNPSTWNPAQRPGDNKWSMTIFARDVDTGMAKWAYQMTPYDEWDFDGVNEMVLADINVKGKPTKALVHFDRNGFGYTLDRTYGRAAGRREVRPGGQLGDRRRHEDRPSDHRGQILDRQEWRGRQLEGYLPRGARLQGPAACGVQSEEQHVLRADQSRLHGLRAVQGRLRRRTAVCRRDVVDVPGAGWHQHGQLSPSGTRATARSSSPRPRSSRSGAACS